MEQTPSQTSDSDTAGNVYAPPKAAEAPKAKRKSWLTRALIGLGAGLLCLILAGVAGAVLSNRAFAKVKPVAVNLANEFARCSLAHDRACVLRLSMWDSSAVAKGEPFVDAVTRKLGTRGDATLDEKSLRFFRNASVGNGLRWRVQLELRVPYENDPAAREVFLLEDHGQGLKVVRMKWYSDVLVLR